MKTDTTPSPRHPARDLLGRYGAIFAAAWAMRHEMAGPRRLADERAFLPAALALQETPAHPAPRRLAWALCALFTIAVVWSIFGRIDIVAVASGRIVVSDRTKTVQPLEASVVKRVLVREGDRVAAGQVLVELDATNARADDASLREQLLAAVSEERRAASLGEAVRANRSPALPPAHPAAARLVGSADAATLVAQLEAEWADFSARTAKLAAEQSRRNAEISTVRQLIAKLDATVPIVQQREADFRTLTAQGFVSSHAGQDRKRERIELEHDLATQGARLAEAKAALFETERTRIAFVAETQRLLAERRSQAALRREQLVQELAKTEQRSRLSQLVAPVGGTVQQVAVHTDGGVVTPAQVLMIVVPRDAEVTAEVAIDNKDIGFVNAGDAARIKLETFPFTRYGTVDAAVTRVTADAVTDDKKGAVFLASLRLGRSTINVEGKQVTLAPGMNVTAEIRTGERRVIEYLLSPVQKGLQEGMRER